uniref:Uncharacterized protein n=1 Tax=viral metagenome TaxID=1070528 RepID=A0A6M3IEJ2_9ZZZZ
MAFNRHFGYKYSHFGEDTKGHDLKAFGDTTGKYLFFDASADTLYVVGTLAQTGAQTISSTLTVTGLSSLNGGIAVVTDKFTVSAAGAVVAASTVKSTGDFTVGDAKLVVTAASGNTLLKGSLGAGTNGTTFTVAADGALAIATDKLTVSALGALSAKGATAFGANLTEFTVSTAGAVVAAVSLTVPAVQSAAAGHLALDTVASDKNVRINSRTFTVAASIVAAQIKPAAGVAMTNGIVGLEVEPRINDTFGGTSIHGIYSAPWKRGTGAAGNLSGDMLAIEGKLQSDSGYSGTITGPAAILRAVNSLHGTVTTGPVVIYANNHEGNVAWTALLEGAEALGTHSLTTDSDKTGLAKSGTLKVRFNNTLYHIQLYANA